MKKFNPYFITIVLSPLIIFSSWLLTDISSELGSLSIFSVAFASLNVVAFLFFYSFLLQGISRIIIWVMQIPKDSKTIFNTFISLSILVLLLLLGRMLVYPAPGDEFAIFLLPSFFILTTVILLVVGVTLKIYLRRRGD